MLMAGAKHGPKEDNHGQTDVQSIHRRTVHPCGRRWHRDGDPTVCEKIRLALPRYAQMTDAQARQLARNGGVKSVTEAEKLKLDTVSTPGFLGINGAAGYGADTPFGGYKASGVGRQNGSAGFDQYTEIKSVAYPAG